jgi:hypothetical protein
MFQNLFFSGFPIFECNSEPETGRISCTPPLEKRPIRSNNPARLELCYIFTYYFVPSVQLHETDPIERTDEGTTQEMEPVRRYDDRYQHRADQLKADRTGWATGRSIGNCSVERQTAGRHY